MAKYFGKVGYAVTEPIEEGSDVWVDKIVERQYYGDLLKHVSKWNINPNSINDNKEISTQISILADPFAINHFSNIKYLEFMGSLWKVTSIEIQYPRLILSVGGLYNGE